MNQSFSEKNFNFSDFPSRQHSASMKWRKYAGRDILPMWVADMDFAVAPCIQTALEQRLHHPVYGYDLAPASLTETIVAAMARDYDWEIQPEWLVWLPGMVTGFNLACRAVCQTDEGVFTATPVYPPFLHAPRLSGGQLVTHPLLPPSPTQPRWEWDWDAVSTTLRGTPHQPVSKLWLLCHPHNPVGRTFSREELHRIGELAIQHDMVICSDEIHGGLVLDPATPHIPLASLSPEIADRTITLMAASKTWNIPGLGCAFAIIPNPVLRRRYLHAMQGIVPHPNGLGYVATEAAYHDGEPWRQALLSVLRRNAAYVEQRVAAWSGVSMTHVEATYLAWLNVDALQLPQPALWFEQHGVGLSAGVDFDLAQDYAGYLRLNFGCPPSQLRAALDRMEAAIQAHG